MKCGAHTLLLLLLLLLLFAFGQQQQHIIYYVLLLPKYLNTYLLPTSYLFTSQSCAARAAGALHFPTDSARVKKVAYLR